MHIFSLCIMQDACILNIVLTLNTQGLLNSRCFLVCCGTLVNKIVLAIPFTFSKVIVLHCAISHLFYSVFAWSRKNVECKALFNTTTMGRLRDPQREPGKPSASSHFP